MITSTFTLKVPAVYILASKPRGTLYVGVTANLMKRIWQHREGIAAGFTRRHGVKTLVRYEQHDRMVTAIAREKALKAWPRQRKIELIRRLNPEWHDLWTTIVGSATQSDAAVARTSDTPAKQGADI